MLFQKELMVFKKGHIPLSSQVK